MSDQRCGVCGEPADFRLELGTDKEGREVPEKDIFLCRRHAAMTFGKMGEALRQKEESCDYGLKGRDLLVLDKLKDGLRRAEYLHPCFAEGVFQGLSRVSEELGELAQSVNHGEDQERIEAEARDLLVVVWRFLRKDYEADGLCDDCKRPCEGCGRTKA